MKDLNQIYKILEIWQISKFGRSQIKPNWYQSKFKKKKTKEKTTFFTSRNQLNLTSFLLYTPQQLPYHKNLWNPTMSLSTSNSKNIMLGIFLCKQKLDI